jgi:hypothetical protein
MRYTRESECNFCKHFKKCEKGRPELLIGRYVNERCPDREPYSRSRKGNMPHETVSQKSKNR